MRENTDFRALARSLVTFVMTLAACIGLALLVATLIPAVGPLLGVPVVLLAIAGFVLIQQLTTHRSRPGTDLEPPG